MPLTPAQTTETMRQFAGDAFVRAAETATVDTDAVEVAITGIAAFIEGNTTAINNALPEPFKSVATTAQKRHLVGLVAAKLAGIL